jgi:hypothetical protein
VLFRNKTRAIKDINISIALADFLDSHSNVQCKLNDIVLYGPPLFVLYENINQK